MLAIALILIVGQLVVIGFLYRFVHTITRHTEAIFDLAKRFAFLAEQRKARGDWYL